MDDAQLARSLQSIGMTCFINYYKIFEEKSRTEPTFVVNILTKNHISNEAGAKIRVFNVTRIFNAGRENDALNIIAKSLRISKEVRDKARLLLDDAVAPLLPRPLTLIPVVAERAAIDTEILHYIREATPSELLALSASALDELRERGIVRSANGPGGDYAELLFVKAFGWTRVQKSVAG